ncbi:MAG: UDP-N-acetylenolpyruvoylglucosamine reductase [Candidatus Magasanikbacteria bacterium RIFOXYA2_FULL_44_8]|uniref:UDP-N-acetylenolpyruvoylglucosamine reductase n=1 Tax=Candidatus Magasanikbacteria bacterium RIFOXYA2_FULL_44_8 TaxID=1798696 RepID=A0A1F6NLG6_9BACT|nr:MAG: UDP-N-acetylenolpyruvoylglucosamine reductase [Candidatus Magasanikbacteria bacterium RIFOXYA2_FULL_44_8]
MDSLYKQLKNFGAVKINVPMSKHTTFNIGGPAHLYVVVEETTKLVGLLNFLSGEGVMYFILGGGSNLLFADDEYEGTVIKIATDKIAASGDTIIVDAGVALGAVVNLATQNSLAGLEWAAGIPGTVGGAVRGNAGAFGGATADSLEKIIVWRDGEVLELAPSECEFGYRDSAFKHNEDVILSAVFKMVVGDKQKILAKFQENVKYRSTRFPPYPCAGSFFKNLDLANYVGDKSILPEKFLQVGKVGAAWFIEQAGMKGSAHGGAKVSDEHANFIVNWNNATQSDVLIVVEKVKEAVYNKFGVELEPEVQIVV